MFQPASWASVSPPRLDPPVPKKTSVLAPSLNRARAASASAISGRFFGDAQKGELVIAIIVLQGLDMRPDAIEPDHRRTWQAVLANCAFEASIDVLLKHISVVSVPVLHGRLMLPDQTRSGLADFGCAAKCA